MAKIDRMAEEFFSQKKIALVGVSEKRDTGCNLNYQKFKDAGYIVYAINPKIEQFKGEPCYPNLASTPEKADAVFVLARPEVTEQIVQQCINVGIKHIWMHCMMGTKPGLVESMTSVSQDAVALCREHGIEVIPGSCPAQFLNPDFGHKMMRGLWRLMGNMKIDGK